MAVQEERKAAARFLNDVWTRFGWVGELVAIHRSSFHFPHWCGLKLETRDSIGQQAVKRQSALEHDAVKRKKGMLEE